MTGEEYVNEESLDIAFLIEESFNDKADLFSNYGGIGVSNALDDITLVFGLGIVRPYDLSGNRFESVASEGKVLSNEFSSGVAEFHGLIKLSLGDLNSVSGDGGNESAKCEYSKLVHLLNIYIYN